jgi:hypothetical protein
MKIDFEITANGYTYRDALHLPDDHGLSEAEIAAMQQARFDAWYEVLTNPPAPAPEEELVSEI